MLQLGHSVEEAPWFDMMITGVLQKARSLACSLVVSIVVGGCCKCNWGSRQLGYGCVCWLGCVALFA